MGGYKVCVGDVVGGGEEVDEVCSEGGGGSVGCSGSFISNVHGEELRGRRRIVYSFAKRPLRAAKAPLERARRSHLVWCGFCCCCCSGVGCDWGSWDGDGGSDMLIILVCSVLEGVIELCNVCSIG